jgi:hypothetical protein
MKSLKLQPANKPEPSSIPIADCDRNEGPKYPYGTQITLNEESLKAMGITELPKVGEKMMICGLVEVCETSKNENISGHNYRCLGLQITDLELEEVKKKKPSKEVMYDKESDGE